MRFYDQFILRSILTVYFVNLNKLENLSICNKTLRELLANMGWTNALVIRESIYLNLVRVFYSNMLISTHTAIRVITNVSRISIEFDVEDLNMILKTMNKELDIYTSRQRIDYLWYSVVNAVMNICRRSDLSP